MNRQKLKRETFEYNGRVFEVGNANLPTGNRQKIKHNKVEYQGITFDSGLEFQFYQYMTYMKEEFGIQEIILQPQFILIPSHTVTCWKCEGTGQIFNEKSKRMNKCKRLICEGGLVTKPDVTYDADFKLIYKDGRVKIIDVKGYLGQDPKFNLKKRIFESIHKEELIIVTYGAKGWKWQS